MELRPTWQRILNNLFAITKLTFHKSLFNWLPLFRQCQKWKLFLLFLCFLPPFSVLFSPSIFFISLCRLRSSSVFSSCRLRASSAFSSSRLRFSSCRFNSSSDFSCCRLHSFSCSLRSISCRRCNISFTC